MITLKASNLRAHLSYFKKPFLQITTAETAITAIYAKKA
jgi:hypothetical protein